jgi:hypothetical protein
MIEMMEYYLPIFGVSCMYFNYLLREDISFLALCPFLIGIVNAFLPMQRINEYLFSGIEVLDVEARYSEVSETFEIDYFKSNPATKNKAL